MNLREQKGLQIADRTNITQSGNLYLVASQSGRGKYKVDPKAQTCSCPDFDFRRQPCKHIYAVEISVRRTKTTHISRGVTTVTETVKVTRQTYKQEWPAYNKAQTVEKAQFQYLLHQLCQGVGEPAQMNGRPRLPLEDMIFAMAFKVYSTVSGRRFISDLKDAHGKGYISQLPAYNTIFKYFESEMVTSYLQMLIEESSLPLASIERNFAVDSSGLSTCRFVQWMHAKYGADPQLLQKRDWIKVHLICGVKTNVVTAVEITNQFEGDSPYFKPLVEATAQNFVINEVSGDKAYLSEKNLQTVVDNNAMPYIPFKSSNVADAKSARRQSSLWKNMYHYFSYNTERFMQSYHKRSNVETTFSMIKSKFGDSLRSKNKRAQINEALCKVLCHNICVLIQSMYELGLKPKFYAQVA
jgi:transposase